MRYFLLFTLLLIYSPAVAYDVCAAYWMDRNTIYDEAGYCFSSKLGKASFDNKGCTTQSPKFTKVQQDEIVSIRRGEKKWQCRIDTSLSTLPDGETGWHKFFDTIPENDDGESSCIGWRGAELELHAGTNANSKVMATIKPGDGFLNGKRQKGDWSFEVVTRDGRFAGMGWGIVPDWSENCTDIAG